MQRQAPAKQLAVEEEARGPNAVPVPFGNVREALSFYTALVPRQRTSVAPKALVPLVDTMLLAKGKLTRWLCTGEGGESSEKLSTDRDALLRVFRANGAWPRARAAQPRAAPPPAGHPAAPHCAPPPCARSPLTPRPLPPSPPPALLPCQPWRARTMPPA